jgi:hypothetical protein
MRQAAGYSARSCARAGKADRPDAIKSTPPRLTGSPTFNPDPPNRLWVADLTRLPTGLQTSAIVGCD